MLDEVPDIPGFAEVWGISAHTCPYCDGFEHRDERIAVLAAGARGEHLAVLLRQWSHDVVWLSNGPHDLAADQLARVQAVGVPVIETPVVGLDSDDGRLRRVRLGDGQTLDRDALFFYIGWQLRTEPRARARLRAARRRLDRRRTPTRPRPSTASTPPATAPTPAPWSRWRPGREWRRRSPSTRA